MSFTQNKSLHLTKSERLRLFIKDIGLPFNQAPEALGLTSSEFLSWWSGHANRVIKNRHFVNLGQYLQIDEDQIFEGTYDKEFIRSVLFSEEAFLPEKYTKNQFSYLRSSAHILKYLTLTRGQHFSDLIMRKMNIPPVIYANLDNKISLNYFMDLLELLARNGLTSEELDTLACVLFLSLAQTPLGERFKKAKTHYECYRVLSESFDLFDSNFVYSCELERAQIRVTALLPFDLHSHLDFTASRVNRLLRYRMLLIGWFPYLSKLPPILPQSESLFTAEGLKTIYTIKFGEFASIPLFSVVPSDKA